MSTIRIESIRIYPVKSLGGIELDFAFAGEEGFEWDRRWMLVDSKGRFLTQRETAEMSLFKCQMDPETLTVQYEGERIYIPLKCDNQKFKKVRVWDSKLKAMEESDEASSWFSKRLDRDITMVRMHPSYKRRRTILKEPYWFDVSFADGYPYLVLSEASLVKLNSKLKTPVSMDRFRPNIVVSGCEAHEEDTWASYRINSADFRNIKPCPRCVVVTIDQHSAEKQVEPLKTLATYRKKSNQVLFGVNAINTTSGVVRKGDEVHPIH